MSYFIPKEVQDIVSGLQEAGFKAYPVGGCVRDLVIGREPKDWDITTSAKPDEIREIFPESVYNNEFGTVGVKTGSDDGSLRVVEVTTFRKEGKYTDKRHPDEVCFADRVEDDLSRRDFTISALALDTESGELIDIYGGQSDIRKKLIRTVGDASKRFEEDALRLMRAVRFVTELGISDGWRIEEGTYNAIRSQAQLLSVIARERVRDELVGILMSRDAAEGMRLLEEVNLLQYIIPELREGIGVDQAKHHTFTVWEHSIRSLEYAAKHRYSLAVRMAALLHDVGKPRTKQGEGEEATFYNHEIVGARMAREILERLAFPGQFVKDVAHLVRYHLFYYNVGEVTESGVRRFLSRVGVEYIDDLIKVREADRIGSGVPKAFPYKLRHLLYMIEKVRRDPLSSKMLAIGGDEVMETAGMESGPRVGWILSALLDEVLDDPEKNNKEYLTKRVKKLAELSDEELQRKAEAGKWKIQEFERGVEEEMKSRYHVK
ncbi:MAG: hypothetical protein DRI48_10895 [Chloroflexi bacterium]|nr:MAG: hypothetical protein DRI48_10895 [Chloroflexota bacterium]